MGYKAGKERPPWGQEEEEPSLRGYLSVAG